MNKKYTSFDEFQSALIKHKCLTKKYYNNDSPCDLEHIIECQCKEKFTIHRNNLWFNKSISKNKDLFETYEGREKFIDLMSKY